MGESAGGKGNCKFWIGHKLQACASGGVEINKTRTLSKNDFK